VAQQLSKQIGDFYEKGSNGPLYSYKKERQKSLRWAEKRPYPERMVKTRRGRRVRRTQPKKEKVG
jgi:hypothetical protein